MVALLSWQDILESRKIFRKRHCLSEASLPPPENLSALQYIPFHLAKKVNAREYASHQNQNPLTL